MKLEAKKDEKTGRMMMAEVAGSEYTVNADLVMIAAGFLGSEDYVTKAFGVEVNERTMLRQLPVSIKRMYEYISQQEICTEDSRWLCGQSGKEEKRHSR